MRSNSVAGTPLAETAPVELHPMQDDCESVSSGKSFRFLGRFRDPILVPQIKIESLESGKP